MIRSVPSVTPSIPTFLTGERIRLRPLVAADADGPYLTWFNDPEVVAPQLAPRPPYTPEQALE